MSTASRRTIANRENAQHSTGPRTEEGKRNSKLNALSHGLASARVVMPWENRDDYEALKASFTESYKPGSDLESELLRRMVDCWWRMNRAMRVESEFLLAREEEIAAGTDARTGDAALALLFVDGKETARMRLVMRYVTGAERAWTRALADFEKAKRERLAAERQQDLLDVWSEAQETTDEQEQSCTVAESGFVSQETWKEKIESPMPAAAAAASPARIAIAA